MYYNVTHLLLINGAGSGTAQLERLHRVAQDLERQIYPSLRVMNFEKELFMSRTMQSSRRAVHIL